MIITPILISNDPVTGLMRKATFIGLNDINNLLMLYFEVNSYNSQGEQVSNSRVRSYQVTLTADNSTFVDPSTGEYVDAETEGALGEYDFIAEAIRLGANIKDMIVSGCLRADLLKRFDV